jgi:hypothetical protein
MSSWSFDSRGVLRTIAVSQASQTRNFWNLKVNRIYCLAVFARLLGSEPVMFVSSCDSQKGVWMYSRPPLGPPVPVLPPPAAAAGVEGGCAGQAALGWRDGSWANGA